LYSRFWHSLNDRAATGDQTGAATGEAGAATGETGEAAGAATGEVGAAIGAATGEVGTAEVPEKVRSVKEQLEKEPLVKD
jgi:hypothetical protein